MYDKVKLRPEDFVVREVMDITSLVAGKGSYRYYLLEKREKGTLEVIQDLIKRFGLPRSSFGFSGLKDRRGISYQYISIKDGPKEDVEGEGYLLKYIGEGETPIELGQAEGNVFRVTLRRIDPPVVEKALRRAEESGFPNYFGEQRFASELYSSEPIAVYLLRGEYDKALREYLCHHPKESIRKRLYSLWNRPHLFKREASKLLSPISLLALRVYLRKRDPEKALRALPKSLKLLFFFSYQALMWNEVLSMVIRRLCRTAYPVPFVKDRVLYFFRDREEAILPYLDLELPFISSEALREDIPSPFKEELLRRVKEEASRFGFTNLSEFLETQVLSLKVFSPGRRGIIVFPRALEFIERGKGFLTVSFFLPKGSYATVLLRKALYENR